MNLKRFFALPLLCCCLLLAACQSMPPVNFSAPNVGYSTKKIDGELKSITVTLARPDEVTGEMPNIDGVHIGQEWQTAIVEAINKMAIFKDDAKKKFSLSVKVTALNISKGGITMTSSATATYTIIDRSNGDVIYTRNISSEGVTPLDFALIGAIRVRESVNRAVQNNITQFLQDLETININKPMFPSQTSPK